MKKYIFLILFLTIIAYIGYVVWSPSGTPWSSFLNSAITPKSIADIVVPEIKKVVSSPPPLRVSKEAEGTLTRPGTIEWTNTERAENNLKPLAENSDLDKIAALRLADMFKRQYFAHVAVDGASAETVSKTVGYEYLAIGENLALGNFTDDKDLVTAWMNSPGHRANILNTHYSQIGVAVEKGIFEGREAWIGVQIFGLPASACPAPEDNIKALIEANKAKLNDFQSQLVALKTELENSARNRDYNALVSQYNSLVNAYNALIQTTQSLVASYNSEVNIFNTCVAAVR